MSEQSRGVDDGQFLTVKLKFDKALTNGQRAEIRRAEVPEALALLPAYYHALPGDVEPSASWQRVVFMLPHADHRDGGCRLGSLLSGKVSELRLFQLVRADHPQDILHLRRLCRHIKPSLDWRMFGRMLYYWGAKEKQKMVEDYFLPQRRASEPMTTQAEGQDA